MTVTTSTNPQIDAIIKKIAAGVRLTPNETMFYRIQRNKNSNLPPAPGDAGYVPHTAPASNTVPGYNDRDRGSDPMRQKPVGTDDPDRGASPTRNVNAGNNTNDQDRGASPTRNQPGYAPSLDDEQRQAQHNANSQGGNTYVPNSSAAPTSAGQPGTDSTGTPASDSPLDTITRMPDENMPNIPKVSLTWHDFTPEAKAKVAGAYAPLYEAINQGKKDATARSANVAAQDKGMYQDLAASNVKDQQATAKRYADTAKDTKASGQQLLDTLAGGASSADAELAKTMADAGLGNGRQGTAAADILSQQIGQEGAATQQAQVMNANNDTNVAAQANDQASYLTNVGAADARQGEAVQEGVANNLTDVLAGFTQQNLSTKADEAQQDLSLNQQMSQNDWTAQQGGADQTWNAYNAAMGQYSAKVSQDQANVTLQNNAAAAQAAAQQAQAKLDQDAAQNAAENQLAQDKLDLANRQAEAAQAAKDAQNAAQNRINQQNADTKASTAGAANANKPTGQGQDPTAANYNPQLDPTSPEYQASHNSANIYQKALLGIAGNPAQATAIDSVMRQTYANLALHGTVNQQDFSNFVVKDAAAKGIPEGIARAAAVAFQKQMGTQQTTAPPAPH